MVMNAGSGFSHEERMPEGEDIHMLQIFLRPRQAGLPPAVQFVELDEAAREGRWRLLVGPDTMDTLDAGNGDGAIGNGDPAPATVRQDVLLHDVRVPSDSAIALPRRDGFDQWLYVFDGTVELQDGTRLGTGAAIAATGEDRIARVKAVEDSDLVLFELARGAPFTLTGSLSRGR